ncbi:helix-turn-helix domain-containing protein [Oligosphaera ethanolica]|uniref:helix-turn-helix domain-containing protein n=1 Tax=Oligosphaera ethanolica TaxID=760260 RepID=UPI0035208303
MQRQSEVRYHQESASAWGSIAELCRRHGISASTIYRWEAQLRARAKDGLVDRSGGKERAAEAEIERLQAE